MKEKKVKDVEAHWKKLKAPKTNEHREKISETMKKYWASRKKDASSSSGSSYDVSCFIETN